MTFLALLAPPLAQAFAKPVVLRVQAPRAVAPGEEIVVVATLRNVSPRPVALIRVAIPAAELGMACGSAYEGPGGPFFPYSRNSMMGQYFRSRSVSPDAFFTLKPGESREVFRENFRQVFADGRPPSEIRAREEARHANLAPGRYRVHVVYRLDPHVPVERSFRATGIPELDRPPEPRIVPPEARRLLNECWRGEVSAAATFEVAPGV